MSNYITDEDLKKFAVATEGDEPETWEFFAEAVSRLFDRECEVDSDFFIAASDTATVRTYRANGTKFLRLGPYLASSITSILVDGVQFYTATVADREYQEKDEYLVFNSEITENTIITVTAKWGFLAIPYEIKQACIEQALLMYRRKDSSFSEMSGVSAAVANAEFSPSFVSVTKRYRDRYSRNAYFG
jgi:hypothetical protein